MLFNKCTIQVANRCGFLTAIVALIGILFYSSCTSAYRHLQPVTIDNECVELLRPVGIATSWYQARVDVLNKHLSGLLLIKEMPGDVMRVVFTNELGNTFFDFEFNDQGEFKVIHIIDQLNKKAVVNTLQKDFELLLGIPFRNKDFEVWRDADSMYYGVMQNGERAYCVTDLNCTVLHHLELGSKRKKKLTIEIRGSNLRLPDSIELQHHTFDMHITLIKLDKK